MIKQLNMSDFIKYLISRYYLWNMLENVNR